MLNSKALLRLATMWSGLLLAATAADAAQSAAEQVAAGRSFAQRVCSPCHVVTDARGETPMLRQPAPSFPSIARRPDFSPAGLRDFLGANHSRLGPHEAMPNPALLDYQIDELIAYFSSLKP